MKRDFIILVLVYVTFMSILSFAAFKIQQLIKEDQAAMAKYMGTEVVLQGDTLTVVDYSFVFDNYTLSNGAEVNRELIENQEK